MKRNKGSWQISTCLIAITATLLSGCSSNNNSKSESPEAIYRIAESLKNSGDNVTASRLYRQVLESDPSNQAARQSLGRSLRDSKQADAAVNFFRAELRKSPESPEILEELGKAYIAAYNADEGVRTYKRLHSLKPSSPWALNGMAICYDLQDNHSQAQECYEKALEKDPKNLKILANLGLSLALAGKTADSITLLTSHADGPEASTNVRHNLAIAYALDGQLDKAKSYFAPELDDTAIDSNLLNYLPG